MDKLTFLKRLYVFCKSLFPGEVVVLAPTKTASGMTYHSVFGFGREYKPVEADAANEVRRLLSTNRFGPIKERLGRVRVVLLDEVSLVNAANMDVMCQLLLCSPLNSSFPPSRFALGDFLQPRPVSGDFDFMAKTWRLLCGDSLLELVTTFRQRDREFVRAIRDARMKQCSQTVLQLVKYCAVDAAKYNTIKSDVIHLMSHRKRVVMHNRSCLEQLCGRLAPVVSLAVDSVALDMDRDIDLPRPDLEAVSFGSRNAALADCVAPKVVSDCLQARIMVTFNWMKHLGVCHGSGGRIVAYQGDGVAVVRFEVRAQPDGVERGQSGFLDCGTPGLR